MLGPLIRQHCAVDFSLYFSQLVNRSRAGAVLLISLFIFSQLVNRSRAGYCFSQQSAPVLAILTSKRSHAGTAVDFSLFPL